AARPRVTNNFFRRIFSPPILVRRITSDTIRALRASKRGGASARDWRINHHLRYLHSQPRPDNDVLRSSDARRHPVTELRIFLGLACCSGASLHYTGDNINRCSYENSAVEYDGCSEAGLHSSGKVEGSEG